jgi:F0F1-type ATP synthase assembly protein I
MDEREKSRQEWERELREDQYNILPADGSRVGHIMAKRSSSPAPIPDFVHLIGFLVSAVLVGIGLKIFYADIPQKVPLGLAFLIAGCVLGFTMLRWKRKS